MSRSRRRRKALVKERDRILDGRRNQLVEVEPGVRKALAACTGEEHRRAAEISKECEQLLSRIDAAIADAVENAPASSLQDVVTAELVERIAKAESVLDLRQIAADLDAALA